MARRFSSKATLSIGLRENIQAQQLHAALDRLLDASGCTECGLNGFDIHLHVLDDDWSRQFSKVLDIGKPQLEGVESIGVGGF